LRKITHAGLRLLSNQKDLPNIKEDGFTLIESFKIANLTVKDEGNEDFTISCSSGNSWKLTEEISNSKTAWITAINDAIEANSLNSMIEENIQNSCKDFIIIQARYGKLSRDDFSIDVTQMLREVVMNQGGSQLILNHGSKESIFGIPKKTKQRFLMIIYSFNGNIQTVVFEDIDAVRIGKTTI